MAEVRPRGPRIPQMVAADISRRGFLNRAGKLAAGGLAAAGIVRTPVDASAQQAAPGAKPRTG